MLRGAWVEEIVAWNLGIDDFPGAFNYYDLRTTDGFTISIKQSVGPKARFDVRGRMNAWDCELAEERRKHDPKAEGWLENPSGSPRQWCDIWILAHLDGEPDLDRVIDPSSWQFAVVDRVWLGAQPNKTLSRAALESRGAMFVSGEHLSQHVRRAAEGLGTPSNWQGKNEVVR